MKESLRSCPDCGTILPFDAPGGLCPRCLMGAGLDRTAEYRTAGPPKAGGTPPKGPTYRDFRATLVDLGLVEETDLDGLAGPAGENVQALARELVKARKITPYQAGALAQGKAKGLLIGSYLVLDKLGTGGMGVVFRARHRRNLRVVALKILPPSFARDPETVRRFRREFRVAAHLNHPNLVAAIEADEDRGVHFLTMDYVQGRDLETLVGEDGPLSVKLALHCAIQIARGLEAAHAQGVVHRDVKPANVMIDAAGNVRVCDLGLARVIEATSHLGKEAGPSLTQTGSYMGSVDFLAPEQADDAKKADHRADIYSLGCTLYYLLTGHPPFPGETMLKRLIAHQERPAPPIRDHRPEVPPALEAVYQRMMAKRPGGRPASMSEVVAALESCRSSPREAGDASADLKAFATTFMKRASPRKERPDPSVFARPKEGPGPISGPALNLEELVMDYRPQGAAHEEIPEDKLPPAVRRAWPPARKWRARRLASPWVAGFTVGVIAMAVALFLLRPREKLEPPRATKTAPPASAFAPGQPLAGGPSPTQSGGPAPAASEEPDPLGESIYTDDFGDVNSGWQRNEMAVEGSTTPFRRDYRAGVYFMEAPAEWRGLEGWNCTAEPVEEVQFEGVVRSVGPEDAYGAAALIVTGLEGQGFQVSISPGGKLAVYDSPWGNRGRRYFEPFRHRAIKGSQQWNTLALRVRRRSIEVLVNGEAVIPPIATDYDLLPTTPQIAIVKGDASALRAEFDRVQVRKLPPSAGEPAWGPPERIIYTDDFEEPLSGWHRGRTNSDSGLTDNVSDYGDGLHFFRAEPGWSGTSMSASMVDPAPATAYQVDVVGRISGPPGVAGGWGTMIVREDGRGLHVMIDRRGTLQVFPSFWGVGQYPNDRSSDPIRPAAIRPAEQWNTLTLRVHNRQIEILVNGQAVGEPFRVDYDLLPSRPAFAESKPDAGTQLLVEIDRVQVRLLP